MANFYFTYGSSESFPFTGGWTIVKAPDRESAINVFNKFHPSNDAYINCSFVYSEEEFKNTIMYEKNNNLGHAEWETLEENIEVE